MTDLRTLIALSVDALATACAVPGGMYDSPPTAPAMGGMGEGKMMPADMAKRQQMMTEHMASMQMMMSMMLDRMPSDPAMK